MAIIHTINRRYQVTTVDDGTFLVLGNVSDQEVGTWRVHFVPDSTWIGSIAVLGRASGKDAYDDNVNFGTIPFRRVQIGGIASDYTIVNSATQPISSDAIILVPSAGLSIAIATSVTNGYGYLYSQQLLGPTSQ